MRKLVKATATVTLAVVVAAGAGVAYADWKAGGKSVATGQTAGKAAAKNALTVLTTTPAGFYPTQVNAGNITVAVDNSNPYDVLMNSAAATTPGASVTDIETTCGAVLTDFTFGPISWTEARAVKGGGTDATGTIAVQAVKNSLPDACEVADIAFEVTVAGVSAPGQAG